jgi:hypothetical protein
MLTGDEEVEQSAMAGHSWNGGRKWLSFGGSDLVVAAEKRDALF